jgi:tetratricopeptide (TPR) repeat protein
LKIAGPFDISLIPDLDRRASILTVLRQYADAEAAYRHALAIREMLYGKEDPDLISTLDGLAYACFGQKKYDVAEPIYQRLLDLWEKHVGKEHPMLAIALDKSAVFFADQKKYDRAGELRVRANAIRAHFLAIGLAQQGTELIEQSKYDEAYVLYERDVKALDPPNPVYDQARGQAEGVLAILKPQLKNPAVPVKASGKDCAAPAKPAAPAKKTPAASKAASLNKK